MVLRHKFITLAMAVSLSFAAISAKAETLADALTYAYENSGLLDQNRALLRAADEDVALAVAATLPVIRWSATASTTRSRTTRRCCRPRPGRWRNPISRC